jgi:hypothetical protein
MPPAARRSPPSPVASRAGGHTFESCPAHRHHGGQASPVIMYLSLGLPAAERRRGCLPFRLQPPRSCFDLLFAGRISEHRSRSPQTAEWRRTPASCRPRATQRWTDLTSSRPLVRFPRHGTAATADKKIQVGSGVCLPGGRDRSTAAGIRSTWAAGTAST